jgi:curved DNA-binding protein CbpA
MKSPRNHYQNLKVDRTATTAEIRKAYRRLASANHPDRNGNSSASVRAMQCINLAYEVLSNTQTRAAHDAWIAREEAQSRRETSGHTGANSKTRNSRAQNGSAEFARGQANDGGSEDDWTRWDGFDFMSGVWQSSASSLNPEHRPKSFDESHLKHFIDYNFSMRSTLAGIHLEYVTPDLIYRAFLIDKQRGKGAPRNLAQAYKSINRALKNDPLGFFGKMIEFFLRQNDFVKGSAASIVGCSIVVALVITWSRFFPS